MQGFEVARTARHNGQLFRRIGRAAAAGSLFAVALAAPASAQDGRTAAAGSPLKLELNRLEPAGDNCRTYLLVDNGKGTALKSLKVDLFAFDTEGVAQKRLAVELGPVQEKKTVVRLFDFPGIACPKIGRVLLNDVLACEGGDSSRESCLERIETATKTSAEFAR
ncbi:Tat pathway signal protein [Methylobacterium haplocladii]|uniref:Tat pathway signal protein n=1 Tax=Methylobacterium haplocladii TaxID=1176176 RepID=UPI0024E0FEA4|nr:Tat pathway signal protein [Methylobacterium haplocladii]